MRPQHTAPAGSAQSTRPARRFPRKTSLRQQATPRTLAAGRTCRERPKHTPRTAVSTKNELAPASDPADTRRGPHLPGASKAHAPRGGFLGKRACARKRLRGHPQRVVPAPAGSAQSTRPARQFPRKTSLRQQATPRTFAGFTKYLQILVLTFPDHCSIL